MPREDLCNKYYMAVKSRSVGSTRYKAFPMSCHSWDCPECRRVKAQKYRRRMSKISDSTELYFWTLTYFHNKSQEEAWATYNKSWNRFRTLLKKRYGEFNYVRVLESHKASPYPHIHVIMDKNIPAAEWGKAAVKAGFGYQLDYTKITGEQALDYIVKYLTKEWTNAEGRWLRKKYRCRMISFSYGLLSPERKDDNWESLLIGSGLSQCIDTIETDYKWDTKSKARVTYEKDTENSYECTVILTDKPITPSTELDDDWCPDWYHKLYYGSGDG